MQIKDIEKIKKIGSTKLIKLSFGNFYIKRRENIEKAINELIVHYAAKDIGIVSPSVRLISFNNDYYILTQDLNDFGNFKTVEELGLTSTENASLLSIFRWLKENFNNYNQLIIGVVQIYLLDVFFQIQDRHNGNWGILKKAEYSNVCILDNEGAFNDELPYLMESFIDRPENFNFQERRKKNLEFFLKNYGNTVNDIFRKFYNFFTPEYFTALLKKIENEEILLTNNGASNIKIQNKDYLIAKYQINYNTIEEVKNKINSVNSIKKI